MGTVRIPLHSRKYPGLFAIIDEVDAETVNQHRWFPRRRNHTFYAQANVRDPHRRSVVMHRLLMGYPDGFEVDHEDGDGLNNQRSNLRICNRSQNNANRIRLKSSTSQYRGVFWEKRHRRWCASLQVNSKNIYLGEHESEIDAALAYDAKAKEVFGEFARLNFPDKCERDAA